MKDFLRGDINTLFMTQLYNMWLFIKHPDYNQTLINRTWGIVYSAIIR